MRQVEKILGECIDCGICMEQCLYLQKVGKSPGELANGFEQDSLDDGPRTAYSCFVCGLCASVCPQGLNIGEMCMEVREMLVDRGVGPLKGHGLMKKDQEFVGSGSFILTQPNEHRPPRAPISDSYVYFPGCSLCGYSPQMVIDSYEYLKGVVPCAAIMLHCCGAPSGFLGRRGDFEAAVAYIAEQMKKVGAAKLIAACPDCCHTLKKFIGDYDDSIEVTTIYHILATKGLPAALPEVEKSTLAVHDSCKARHDTELQNAVRAIITQLGHSIEEMSCSREKTYCCGNGGMVPYVDQQLYKSQIQSILASTTNAISTYCAGCRETLAAASNSVTHLLDLVFNPNWPNDISNKPNNGVRRRENQGLLKKILIERMGES